MNQEIVTFEGFQQGPEGAAVGICFVVAYLLFALLGTALAIFLFSRIFSKAGFNWAMAFILLVPGVGGLVVMIMLAFMDWPALKELQALKGHAQAPSAPASPPPGDFR
ncbi:MAG: hypothetical protein ACYSUT_07830 [Planctomycetota bacterium]|jgi:hypothetical protein